jgi:hypothetical protein
MARLTIESDTLAEPIVFELPGSYNIWQRGNFPSPDFEQDRMSSDVLTTLTGVLIAERTIKEVKREAERVARK